MTVPRKNWLEWSVFGTSLGLLVTVAALLVYAQVTSENRPASLVALAGEPVRTATGFAVPLEVHNRGDVTAESVQIEAVLVLTGGTERSTVELAFVPYRSRRRAWVLFEKDPRGGRLTVRVLGYQDP